MGDASKLAGLRKYIRRNNSLSQLATLATALYSVDTATLETALTSAGFEGGSASGQLRGIDRFDLLNIVEDLHAEMTNAGVTSWTAAQSAADFRNLTTIADRGATTIRL